MLLAVLAEAVHAKKQPHHTAIMVANLLTYHIVYRHNCSARGHAFTKLVQTRDTAFQIDPSHFNGRPKRSLRACWQKWGSGDCP